MALLLWPKANFKFMLLSSQMLARLNRSEKKQIEK